MEEKTLKQKSKLDWLRLGDGNNSYFHASIKAENNSKKLNMLYKDDGTLVTSQTNIRDEILNYYIGLMGTSDSTTQHIDVLAMREGHQLNIEKRQTLVTPAIEHEIFKALSFIEGLKAPGIYGFGAKLFKASWLTINDDVVAFILDFFENEKFFKAFNNTIVPLIPKSDDVRTIKDYRPIVVCTTF